MDAPWTIICPFPTKAPADRVDLHLWAYVSLAPIVLLVWQTATACATRDLTDWFGLAGMVFTAACVKGIKEVWKDPRPALNCHHLDTCGKFGMPSSHTQLFWGCCLQLAAFQASWATLLWLQRRALQHRAGRPAADAGVVRTQRLLDAVLVFTLLLLSLLVGWSRVVLGYHTSLQVTVGGIVGNMTAYMWYRLLHALARPLYRLVRHWWIMQVAGIVDNVAESAQPAQTPSAALQNKTHRQ